MSEKINTLRNSTNSGRKVRESISKTSQNLFNSMWTNIKEARDKARELRKDMESVDGAKKPSEDAFVNAYIWFVWLKPKNRNYLTVVDFYPNNKPGGLFYIINIRTNTVEYSNSVGHWSGSRGKKDSPSGSPDSYSN